MNLPTRLLGGRDFTLKARFLYADEQEIARYLRVTKEAVRQWMKRGQFIRSPYLLSGRFPLWRRMDVVRWTKSSGFPKRAWQHDGKRKK